MGGGVWQDNFDGTYTQLDDDYYVPATGYSYLDLYLMGLISAAEVPDFFILRNLVPSGNDANGHPIFKADRTKVTIQDVIASEDRAYQMLATPKESSTPESWSLLNTVKSRPANSSREPTASAGNGLNIGRRRLDTAPP